MKVIVYSRPEGDPDGPGVSVIVPAGEPLERCWSLVPPGAAAVAVERDGHPLLGAGGDRSFREAWRQQGARVEVNMPTARAIQLSRIRAARDRLLQRLDLQQVRWLAQGEAAKVAALEARKQALRDLPQTLRLEEAATPEALRATWPELLQE